MTIQRSLIALAIGVASATASINSSADTTIERLEKAEQRIKYLEQRSRDQAETLETKRSKGDSWTDTVELSGLIEWEIGINDPENGPSTSDSTVATVELGLAAQISDVLSTEIVLLHEEDDTNLEVDVAVINYQIGDTGWTAVAGQTYVPFGVFDTALVSDPLTLELGETRETVGMFQYDKDNVSAALYAFNGNNKERGSNKINNWGANIGYSDEKFSVVAGYINDLGDSDTIQGTLGSSTVSEYTAGISFSAAITTDVVTFIAEQVSALDSFNDAPLANAEPVARNIEVNFPITILGKDSTIAVARQTTDEASALDLAKDKDLLGLSIDVSENLGLGFEVSKSTDYSDDETTAFVAQVAVSF